MIRQILQACFLLAFLFFIFFGCKYKASFFGDQVVHSSQLGTNNLDPSQHRAREPKSLADVDNLLSDEFRRNERLASGSPSPESGTSSSFPDAGASTSSGQTWRDGYDQVINNSFSSTMNFYGWWKVQAWNGGSRSPVATYTTQMIPYPGVIGSGDSSSMNGKVVVTQFDNFDLQFDLQVTNAGKDCTALPNTNVNGCTVAIHEGDSCDTVETIGTPYFDSSKIQGISGNPFETTYYVSNSVGLSNSLVSMFNGGNGYDKFQNDRRAVVIYDSLGAGILCGVMATDQPLSERSSIRPTQPTIKERTSAPTPAQTNQNNRTESPTSFESPLSPMTSVPVMSTQLPQLTSQPINIAEPIEPSMNTPPPINLNVSPPPLGQKPIAFTAQPSFVTPKPFTAETAIPTVRPINNALPIIVPTSQPNNNNPLPITVPTSQPNNNNPLPITVPTPPPNPFPIFVPTPPPAKAIMIPTPYPFPRPIFVPTFAPRPVIVPTFAPRPVIVPTIGPRPVIVPTIGPRPSVPMAPASPLARASPRAPASPVLAPASPRAPASPVLAPTLSVLAPASAPRIAPLASPMVQVAPRAPPVVPRAPHVPTAPVAPLTPVTPKPPVTVSSGIAPVLPVVAPVAQQPSPGLEDGVAVKVVYNGKGWIGIGLSQTGKMISTEGTVIGIPNGGVSTDVMIYNMLNYTLSGSVPWTADQQVLQNQTIDQTAGDKTIMAWRMPFPDNSLGIFPVIWAYGTSNSLAYHGSNRSSKIFPIILASCADSGADAGPNCKPDDPNYDQVTILKAGVLSIYTKQIKIAPVSAPIACSASNPLICGCSNVNQADYRGYQNTTLSGRTCQAWASQSPQAHTRTPENFPNADLRSNYCRNPDEETGAWCYTTDVNKRWELCAVPNC